MFFERSSRVHQYIVQVRSNEDVKVFVESFVDDWLKGRGRVRKAYWHDREFEQSVSAFESRHLFVSFGNPNSVESFLYVELCELLSSLELIYKLSD